MAGKCPNCGYQNQQGAACCGLCGLVFKQDVKSGKPGTGEGETPLTKQEILEKAKASLSKNRWLFVVFWGVLLCVTSVTQNSYSRVKHIHPDLLREPVQKEIKDPVPIRFQNEDGLWELTPLDEYEINGLLVNKLSYDAPSGFHLLWVKDFTQNTWPFDFALLWGSNVKNKHLKDWSFTSYVGFSRAVQPRTGASFNDDEISNNHLIINRKDLKKKAGGLVLGDQIKIKGKLVRFRLQVLGKDRKTVVFEESGTSSRIRQDNGCEVIYVEDIQVLKKANLISRFLFQTSKIGLMVTLILSIISWFRDKWRLLSEI